MMNELKSEGWYVDEFKLQEALEEDYEGKSKNDLVKLLLDLDVKEYGQAILSDKVTPGKVLKGPVVVQLAKWQNVSYPKISDHTENNGVCCCNLSDGSKTMKAMSTESVSKLDGKTPYGTKILLFGEVPVENGILQISNNNTKILGGRVEKQVEKWKAEKLGNKENRGLAGGSAPKWVPFEKRNNVSRSRPDDGFKSIQTTNEDQKKGDTGNSEFDSARQAEIQNLKEMRQAMNLPQVQLKKDILPEKNPESWKQERPDTGSNFNQRGNENRERSRGRGSGNHGHPRETRGRGRGNHSRDNDDANQYAPPKATFSLFDAVVSSGMPPGLESKFSQMTVSSPEYREPRPSNRGRGGGNFRPNSGHYQGSHQEHHRGHYQGSNQEHQGSQRGGHYQDFNQERQGSQR
ncbi:hypothetical protein FO519_004087, partial [Halicephalobus sp. NKZ332]